MSTVIPTRRAKSPFFIGLFVLIAGLITVGALLWLGTQSFSKQEQYYVTYFDGSVSGLEKGRPVKYLGLPIGSVVSVEMAPDNRLIEVVMSLSRRIEAADSLRVSLEMSSIAGGQFLQLFYPGDDPELLSLHPELAFDVPNDWTYVKSAPSSLKELELAMTEVVNNLRLVDTRGISRDAQDALQSMTGLFTSHHLHSLIAGLDSNTMLIREMLEQVRSQQTINNVELVSENLVSMSENLVAMSSLLKNQSDSLNLNRRLNHSFAKLDTLIDNTNRSVATVSIRGEQTLLNSIAILRELERTSREMRSSLDRMTRYPGGTFLTEDPPHQTKFKR